MKKNFSSVIIDNLVLIFSVFTISFLWIRYYEHNSFLILFYTVLITFIVCATIHFFSSKKQKKQKILQKEANFIEKISNFLIFSSKLEILATFEKCIKKRNIETKKCCDFLIFNDNILRPIYSKHILQDYDIIESILKIKSKKLTGKTLIISAVDFSKEAKDIAKKYADIKIILLDEKQTYLTFFKPVNFDLQNKDESENKKTTKEPLKAKLKKMSLVAFNRQRFKTYLCSAIVLLVGSYFMRYNLYYLISSTILLLLSFFSYFNKPFNKPTQNIFAPKKEQ